MLFLDSDIIAQTAPSASEGLPSIFSPHFSLAETNNIWSSSVYKVCNHGVYKCNFWLLTWEAVKDMCPLHLFTMSSYMSHQASIYTKSFIFCGMMEHHLHILSVAGWWCHSNILQHHIHSEHAQTAIVRHGIFLLCRTQSCEYGSVSFYPLISWMAIKKYMIVLLSISFSEFLRSGSLSCSRVVSAQACKRDSSLSFSSHFTGFSLLRVSV